MMYCIWVDTEVNTNMAMKFILVYWPYWAEIMQWLLESAIVSFIENNHVERLNPNTGVPFPNTLGQLEQQSMHDFIKSQAFSHNNGHHDRHSLHNGRTRHHNGRDSPHSHRHSRGSRRSSHGNWPHWQPHRPQQWPTISAAEKMAAII